MITTCLQVLTITTKGDVLGAEAQIRLGITQAAPLSPILFLIYLNGLHEYCPRKTYQEVIYGKIRTMEITLTADNAMIHTKGWAGM